MITPKCITAKRSALANEATRLQQAVERLDRLIPALGKSAALVGDGFEDLMDIVELGDSVYSKYGDEGVVIGFEHVDAENWYDVVVLIKQADRDKIFHIGADRLNHANGVFL